MRFMDWNGNGCLDSRDIGISIALDASQDGGDAESQAGKAGEGEGAGFCGGATSLRVVSEHGEAGAPVLDVAEVVALEQRIARAGTPLLTLMQRAGKALARTARSMAAPGSSVAVLAGPGNNGGDGWVAAQRLAHAGYRVVLITRGSAEALIAEPARTAALAAMEKGGFEISIAPGLEDLRKLLVSADLIIDAILGTGFAYDEVREPYATWIREANAARIERGIPLLAADCPSGLNARTGTAASDCIRADATVTMLAFKTGLVQPAAAPYTGTLKLATLGVDPSAFGE